MKRVLLVMCLVFSSLFFLVGSVSAEEARLTSPIVNEEGTYETDSIKIKFKVYPDASIGMIIVNKTTSPIRINFNEASIECVANWNVRDLYNKRDLLVIPPDSHRVSVVYPLMSVPLTMKQGYDEKIYLPLVINGEEMGVTFTLIMK